MISLDVFRGLTIAGMIVVNDAGSWSHIYTPLHHASWHGITPTDFVFPFFLFIVGVSIALSYTRQMKSGKPKGDMVKKIITRTAIIFGLGVFSMVVAKGYYAVVLGAGLRLQQYPSARGYCNESPWCSWACSLIFLRTDWKTQAWIGAGLLVGYWLIMAIIPVPIDETVRIALETGQVKASGGMLDIGPIKQISDVLHCGKRRAGSKYAGLYRPASGSFQDCINIPGTPKEYLAPSQQLVPALQEC